MLLKIWSEYLVFVRKRVSIWYYAG